MIITILLTEEVGDEFFEVTEQDVRTLWADAQRKLYVNDETIVTCSSTCTSEIATIDKCCCYRQSAVEQPLMTKTMRMAQKLDSMSRYERVAIRVQFPNKLVLQALFRPRETVHALYQFVAKQLQDSNMEFYLCT